MKISIFADLCKMSKGGGDNLVRKIREPDTTTSESRGTYAVHAIGPSTRGIANTGSCKKKEPEKCIESARNAWPSRDLSRLYSSCVYVCCKVKLHFENTYQSTSRDEIKSNFTSERALLENWTILKLIYSLCPVGI